MVSSVATGGVVLAIWAGAEVSTAMRDAGKGGVDIRDVSLVV